jgi:predicted RNase H-like nuclease (RuvC/YqgF family)
VEDDTQEQKMRDALEACEETVEELKEENAQLRQSSRAFGDLAERLNARRHVGRGGPTHSKQ